VKFANKTLSETAKPRYIKKEVIIIFKLRKKTKTPNNTHKYYSVESFQMNQDVVNNISDKVSQYRDDFEIDFKEEKVVSDLGQLLYSMPLIEELKYYYNNDLCISVAQAVILAEAESIDRRINSYFLENAILRTAAIWEYLFIIVNEVLQTELIVGRDIREQLIEVGCHDIQFVPSGDGYKVVTKPIDEEIRKAVEPELKKRYKLFNISYKNKSNELLKTIKKKYSKKENIQLLFDLYKSREVEKVIQLRNEIVHRRPLTAKFSLAPNGLFPGNAVSLEPNGWFDFNDIQIIMEKNITAVKEAIKTLIEVIFYNDIPNLKENEINNFIAFEVGCEKCLKEFLINEVSANFFINENLKIICPLCNSEDTKVIRKKEVNDTYYFSNLKEYSDFLFEYWGKE
jgi:Zn finger protein HypA/HybF involved in hydrogenase expression